jgi:DNA-binding protein Fis
VTVEPDDTLTPPPPAGPALPDTGDMSLQEMERVHIIQVLEQNGGNKSKAARILQISRSTLREKLKAYGIA